MPAEVETGQKDISRGDTEAQRMTENESGRIVSEPPLWSIGSLGRDCLRQSMSCVNGLEE